MTLALVVTAAWTALVLWFATWLRVEQREQVRYDADCLAADRAYVEAARAVSIAPYAVRAMEADGFLIGIYGPFLSQVAALDAAKQHDGNGLKTDVVPLLAPSSLWDLDDD